MKSTVHSANALVGTCKMGADTDKMAVVDSKLKVSLSIIGWYVYHVSGKGFSLRDMIGLKSRVCRNLKRENAGDSMSYILRVIYFDLSGVNKQNALESLREKKIHSHPTPQVTGQVTPTRPKEFIVWFTFAFFSLL